MKATDLISLHLLHNYELSRNISVTCVSIYKRASHHQIFIPGSMSEAGYVSVAFPVWELDLGKSFSVCSLAPSIAVWIKNYLCSNRECFWWAGCRGREAWSCFLMLFNLKLLKYVEICCQFVSLMGFEKNLWN